MRLQVFLSRCGAASRRAAEKLIDGGRVTVNGMLTRQMGVKIDPFRDKVCVDGKEINLPRKICVMLNKPAGYITTKKDIHALQNVMKLLPAGLQGLHPVGRLDKLSRGLLLLTNDGDLTYRLTHPKFAVDKVYQVYIKGLLKDADKNALETGVFLAGEKTAPCRIYDLETKKETTALKIKIHEGKKRQIRLMFAKLGYLVLDLLRVAIGHLTLGDLKEGQWRELEPEEIKCIAHN